MSVKIVYICDKCQKEIVNQRVEISRSFYNCNNLFESCSQLTDTKAAMPMHFHPECDPLKKVVA